MIDMRVRIHDRYSVEFKVGVRLKSEPEQTQFAVNAWMFIPNSLDINPMTYSKESFYRDVKSYMRLITPKHPLSRLVEKPYEDLLRSAQAVATTPDYANISDFEYRTKLFMSILRSSLRDQIDRITLTTAQPTTQTMLDGYLTAIQNIRSKYHALRGIIAPAADFKNVEEYFAFGDEFMCNIVLHYTFRLLERIEAMYPDRYTEAKAQIMTEIDRVTAYKKQFGYVVAQKGSPQRNREIIYRQGLLKKYVGSTLFLNTRKKRDGVLVEQIYYSMAAGLSMIFATIVSFSFQQKFGNFTMPLFVALVVSYMLKDRIKDLMRYYFANRMGNKYFDSKTCVGIKNEELGWVKEGVDFIAESKVPKEVLQLRSRSSLLEAENRTIDEKILLYRTLMQIDCAKFSEATPDETLGINDIIRFNVLRFTNMMANPEVPVHVVEPNGKISVMPGQKVYYLTIVMQLQQGESTNYRKFRIVFNREGIIEVDTIE